MTLLKVRRKFCNQDNSQTVVARGFKLGQIIQDNEWIK